MALPPVDSEKIEQALQKFDLEERNRPEWQGWEQRRSHLYAIEANDRLYPVKEIVSLATGTPVGKFSGGKASNQANRFVRDRGFDVISLRTRNPSWLRDELILALDLYLRNRQSPPGKTSHEVAYLSELLNRLGKIVHGAVDGRFRNSNGVYMKMMNYRRLDPEFPGTKGLTHGGKLEEEIWSTFSGSPNHCHEAATAIQEAIEAFESGEAEYRDVEEDDFYEAEEGRAVTRLHIVRERKKSLVDRKKRNAIKNTGKLECEACRFDFRAVYGARGDGFIECHHEKPVYQLKHGERTRLKDLRLLCANCHRMIHVRRPWLTVAELKDLVAPLSQNHITGMPEPEDRWT